MCHLFVDTFARLVGLVSFPHYLLSPTRKSHDWRWHRSWQWVTENGLEHYLSPRVGWYRLRVGWKSEGSVKIGSEFLITTTAHSRIASFTPAALWQHTGLTLIKLKPLNVSMLRRLGFHLSRPALVHTFVIPNPTCSLTTGNKIRIKIIPLPPGVDDSIVNVLLRYGGH